MSGKGQSKSSAASRWIERLSLLEASPRSDLTLTTLTRLSLPSAHKSVESKVINANKATVVFLPCDGAGSPVYVPQTGTILLRRSDFLRLHDYTLQHGPLRDFCLFRVPMKCGLRPGEIRRLRWEDVNFETLTLNVFDVKKHERLPVPMDPATADYLMNLKGEKSEGLVLERSPKCNAWKDRSGPMGADAIDKLLKKWARLAACETWQRMRVYDLRHYFAANWIYPSDGKRSGNLHALSRILRHETVLNTQVYLSRLVFYEDLQQEYNRLQSGPFDVPPVGNTFFDSYCRVCVRRPTCKYIDQAMNSPWAASCRWFENETVSKTVSKRDCVTEK